MAMQDGEREFVPALEEGLVRMIRKETGLTPEELLAMDFEGRRAELEKIGVRLEDPKPNFKKERTSLCNG